MNAISSPETLTAAKTLIVLSPRAAAAPQVNVNPHRFADCMETALTGIVITGVLLFAAGLLRYAVPLCTARLIGDDMLYALAIISGGFTIFMAMRGIFGR